MKLTVVIPSYRRPQDLLRCLAAVRGQQRPADEVLVVLRREDEVAVSATAELATTWPEFGTVFVGPSGQVGALNAGLDAATGDVMVITDDDGEPDPDWLLRIEREYADPKVAGVGGRDEQAGIDWERETVGRVQWFGRLIGNHHVGIGGARDVDVIKGVNCSFRIAPLRTLRFDTRLRGAGAQVHWELSLCLGLKRAGWRLRYDPAIRVRHHIGIRHDADQLHRGRFDAEPQSNAVHNETLALSEHLHGVRALAFVCWAVLVGTSSDPGLVQLPRVLVRDGRTAFARWGATMRGRRSGWRAGRRGRD